MSSLNALYTSIILLFCFSLYLFTSLFICSNDSFLLNVSKSTSILASILLSLKYFIVSLLYSNIIATLFLFWLPLSTILSLLFSSVTSGYDVSYIK